jgi:hypothetical protein
VDDSVVIYSDQFNTLHLGIIVGIVNLKTIDEIIFIIDEANICGCDSFKLDGIEFINDLYIDATLLVPRETISLKFEFLKKSCISN